MSNGRNYPPRGSISGDCPVCYKYQSRGQIVWRDKVFCCKEHMRKYMFTILADEVIEEYDDVFEELAKP